VGMPRQGLDFFLGEGAHLSGYAKYKKVPRGITVITYAGMREGP
jgi:hypothetical protein